MAKTYSTQVYSGTLTTSSVDVTSGGISANNKFIMKGFAISNADSADKMAELLIDDIRILPYVKAIPTGDTLIRDNLNIPVETTKTIKVKGEVATNMDYYIWGILETTT